MRNSRLPSQHLNTSESSVASNAEPTDAVEHAKMLLSDAVPKAEADRRNALNATLETEDAQGWTSPRAMQAQKIFSAAGIEPADASAAATRIEKAVLPSSSGSELEATLLALEEMPKLARGDRKAARGANDEGLRMMQAGRFADATVAFNRAFAHDPADMEVLGNLSYAYLKNGQLAETLRISNYAVRITPRRAGAWNQLAVVHAQRGADWLAVRAFVVLYTLSSDQAKTRDFLNRIVTDNSDERVRDAAKHALLALQQTAKQNEDSPQSISASKVDTVNIYSMRKQSDFKSAAACPSISSKYANEPSNVSSLSDPMNFLASIDFYVSRKTKYGSGIDDSIKSFCKDNIPREVDNYQKQDPLRRESSERSLCVREMENWVNCFVTPDELKACTDKTEDPDDISSIHEKRAKLTSKIVERCESVLNRRYADKLKLLKNKHDAEIAKADEEKKKSDIERNKSNALAIFHKENKRIAIEKSGISEAKRIVWGGNGTGFQPPGHEYTDKRCLINWVYQDQKAMAKDLVFSAPKRDYFEKDEAYNNRVSASELSFKLENTKANNIKKRFARLQDLANSYLRKPMITDLKYDSSRDRFTFYVADDWCNMVRIPVEMLASKDAESMKKTISGLNPIVVFELEGDDLFARSIYFYTSDGKITEFKPSYKVPQTFSKAEADKFSAAMDQEYAKKKAEEEDAEKRSTQSNAPSTGSLESVLQKIESSPNNVCHVIAGQIRYLQERIPSVEPQRIVIINNNIISLINQAHAGYCY
jgi:hypothetical protein